MRVALIADTFPPLRTSGAVQLRDLSLEFARQGHILTVLLPTSEINQPWILDDFGGVQVLRLRSPKFKDINYVRRTIAEFLMPFFMKRNLLKSPLAKECWGGVVWYSPTIFLGPLVKYLRWSAKCNSYLIIRDIFPEWAVDMGLMGRGVAYRIFKLVECYQYSVADTIGVQTPGNLSYFSKWIGRGDDRKLEVLQNWLADAPVGHCSIDLKATKLAGRRFFVYAGNMGVAQGMDILLDLAEHFLARDDIGFVFVGRGSDAQRIREDAVGRSLTNVLFYDEIAPEEIPALYTQCHVGLVALDPRHKTHNIPGKFLTYMQSGLPVLASINPGNDLEKLIFDERVGVVCTVPSVQALATSAEAAICMLDSDDQVSRRCRDVSARLFSASAAVRQIVRSLGRT